MHFTSRISVVIRYSYFPCAYSSLVPVGFQTGVQGSRIPIKLYRLSKSPAIGAAILGAQHAGYNITIDYASNTSELDCFLPVP